MTDAKVLRVYLGRPMLDDARAGQVNILNRIASAFDAQGFRVEYCPDSAEELLLAVGRRGYSLLHMHEPISENSLCLRLSYFYPFWRIENTNERWEWDIAKAEYASGKPADGRAEAFVDRRRHMMFGGARIVDHDFVLVPLQGKLLVERSFQSMSPIAMIEALVEHEPERDIVLRPHPRETLDDDEREALRALVDRVPRMRIVRRPLEDMLPRCSYVVTQNSAVALRGMFLQKAAVTFARSDFHHGTHSVFDLGAAEAISRARAEPVRDVADYLHWFFHTDMIDGAGRHTEDQVLARVRRFGWKL